MKMRYAQFYWPMNFSRSASGLKKVLSSHSGQEDFPARQVHVAFHSCLPNGQGPRQVVYQLNAKRSKLGQEKKKWLLVQRASWHSFFFF